MSGKKQQRYAYVHAQPTFSLRDRNENPTASKEYPLVRPRTFYNVINKQKSSSTVSRAQSLRLFITFSALLVYNSDYTFCVLSSCARSTKVCVVEWMSE